MGNCDGDTVGYGVGLNAWKVGVWVGVALGAVDGEALGRGVGTPGLYVGSLVGV